MSPRRAGARRGNSSLVRSPTTRQPIRRRCWVRPIYERCCGLDVHKKTVVACRLTPEGIQTRTFGTMTDDLILLREGLLDGGGTHVAMESTGVYGKPVFNPAGNHTMTTLVGNALPVKAAPRRKTGVRDAEWLPEVL